eukprot:8301761-Pyramimonas_sp.AAC.1
MCIRDSGVAAHRANPERQHPELGCAAREGAAGGKGARGQGPGAVHLHDESRTPQVRPQIVLGGVVKGSQGRRSRPSS